jgi:cytoskeletal protein RodZ
LEFGDEKRGEIVNYLDFDRQMVHQHNEEMMREVRVLRLGRQLLKNSGVPSRRSRAHKMRKTLLMKGRSLMLTVLFTLSLAALLMFSGTVSKAEAQTTNTVLQQLQDDGKLNSDVSEQLKAQNRLENSSGAATATPTASPSAPATSASPSAPATASAAGGQYGEPVSDPETYRNSSVLPLMLGVGTLLVGGGLLARRLIR